MKQSSEILQFEQLETSAQKSISLSSPWVPVEEEPQHHFRFANEYVHIYDVRFYAKEQTLWHRHDKDTFYVNVNAVDVYDQTYNMEKGETRHLPPGIGFCRGHEKAPLIHQITNESEHLMHMIGAEHLKQPPVLSKMNWMDKHVSEISNISDGFTVKSFKIELHPGEEMVWEFDFYGLLVVVSDSCLLIEQEGNRRTESYFPGSHIWYENPPKMMVKNVGELPFVAVLGVWL